MQAAKKVVNCAILQFYLVILVFKLIIHDTLRLKCFEMSQFFFLLFLEI